MGTFLGNVQVKGAGADSARQALDAYMTNLGLARVERPEEAQRIVAVAHAGDWLSLFDQASESQDLDEQNRLAAAMSRSLAALAVSVMVHDSDVLYLNLFQAGEQRDRYCSMPEFEELDPDAVHGTPEEWRPAFSGNPDPARLRAIWDHDETFVEEKLTRMAPLLGVPEEHLACGFRDVYEEGAIEDAEYHYYGNPGGHSGPRSRVTSMPASIRREPRSNGGLGGMVKALAGMWQNREMFRDVEVKTRHIHAVFSVQGALKSIKIDPAAADDIKGLEREFVELWEKLSRELLERRQKMMTGLR